MREQNMYTLYHRVTGYIPVPISLAHWRHAAAAACLAAISPFLLQAEAVLIDLWADCLSSEETTPSAFALAAAVGLPSEVSIEGAAREEEEEKEEEGQ
eukprot:CAMPEP_0117672524 /NCGR_PEP_ID=MMETSP0804-20121206/13953_1 /TAXON_ID=1074897 /ORGANISM="Tetraselmis astigmatica, Strain CCMP880" /LENGTH=97 /DNA_ID=CAMNT_0005481137 /DNA_START=72 /DNA_END=366 /DNA_ORIENTATION=+